MEVSVEKKQITETVQSLEKVAGKQLNLDVLKCIHIKTGKGVLELEATNLDIGINSKIQAKIKTQGEISTPATTLSAFLNNTDGTEVLIKESGGAVDVSAGRASAKINTISSADFPTLPKVSGEKVKISPRVFSRGLRDVWYSASPSSMKPELSSVFVSGQGGEIKFVATDSFRLAEKKINTDDTDFFPNLLIPLKNVGEIIRNTEKGDAEMFITADDNQLGISFGDVYITSRLVDGAFPDYEQIIPKEHTTEAILLKQDLMQALKTTSIFTNRFNQTTISVDPKKKSFSINASGSEVGESRIMPDASMSGEEIRVSFNQKYITDSLQSISEDSVILRFFGQGRPMVIRGVSDPSFMYLTMPMNR